MKDNLKRKLKAKKILNQTKIDKPKVYEMPDEYKKELQQLADFLHKREEAMEIIPKMRDEDRVSAEKALKGLDKNIEVIENELAKEYEEYQAKMRREEEINEAYARGLENIETLYVWIKNEMPHKFHIFHDAVTQNMSEEDSQEFFDRIAIREANVFQALLASPVID